MIDHDKPLFSWWFSIAHCEKLPEIRKRKLHWFSLFWHKNRVTYWVRFSRTLSQISHDFESEMPNHPKFTTVPALVWHILAQAIISFVLCTIGPQDRCLLCWRRGGTQPDTSVIDWWKLPVTIGKSVSLDGWEILRVESVRFLAFKSAAGGSNPSHSILGTG